jgi:hypothetical protein
MDELRKKRVKADLESDQKVMGELVAEYENIGAVACAEFCKKKRDYFLGYHHARP